VFVGCGKKEKYDTIVVTLTYDATFSDKEYTVEDFADVGAINIELANYWSWQSVKAYLAGEEVDMSGINLETFRRMYVVYLQNNSKQNMLNAITKLEKRSDVESARQSIPVSAQ